MQSPRPPARRSWSTLEHPFPLPAVDHFGAAIGRLRPERSPRLSTRRTNLRAHAPSDQRAFIGPGQQRAQSVAEAFGISQSGNGCIFCLTGNSRSTCVFFCAQAVFRRASDADR
jgi:hypothetical protein